MAVVVVVSVLATLLLPALANARRSAQNVACLSRLRSILQGYLVVANDNRGEWANYVPLDAVAVTVEDNGNAYGVPYFGQVRVWAPALRDVIWSTGDSGEALACPTVYRNSEWRPDGQRQYDYIPYAAGMASYYYSAAMISRRSLWDPSDSAARRAPDQHRARVGVHQVFFPSDKVVIAEVAAHHVDSEPCFTQGSAVLNAASADGHAATRTVTNGNGALPWTQPAFGFPQGVTVPFSAAADGAAGRDQ